MDTTYLFNSKKHSLKTGYSKQYYNCSVATNTVNKTNKRKTNEWNHRWTIARWNLIDKTVLVDPFTYYALCQLINLYTSPSHQHQTKDCDTRVQLYIGSKTKFSFLNISHDFYIFTSQFWLNIIQYFLLYSCNKRVMKPDKWILL